jgi:excisionase family DNA binding protein
MNQTEVSESSHRALPDILTTEELATFLRVSPKTIYAMVQRKLLPHRHVGTGKRSLRFSRDAVLEWLRSGQGCAPKR